MTEYIKKETNIDDNYQKSYALIFGQCTNHMHSRLEDHKYYHRIRGDHYVFLLVTSIKGLTFKFDGHNHPSHALRDAKRDFCCYYHTVQTKNPQYLETFKKKALVIDSYGRAIGADLVLTKEDIVGAENLTGA